MQSKINHLISSYKKTKDWARNTGQGVLASDGVETFNDALNKMFPYYSNLDPVMCDRPSVDSYTNDDEYSSSDDPDQVPESVNLSIDSQHSYGEIDDYTTPARSSSISIASSNKVSSTTQKGTSTTKTTRKKINHIRSQMASASTRNLPVLNFSGSADATDKLIQSREKMQRKKLRIAKRECDIKRDTFLIQRPALQASARVEVAKLNVEMMKMRKQYKKENPESSKEELDLLFPLAQMPEFQQSMNTSYGDDDESSDGSQ